MSDLPPPPVAPDVDIRGMSSFMLDVDRLLASELVAVGTPEECWAAFMLWCRAWKQTPAGSLPNDDRILAAFSMAGKRWPRVRDMALRGFTLCSDGRLYHHVLVHEVEAAWSRRKAYRNDQERLRKWRDERKKKHDNTPDETPSETQSETQSETRFKRQSEQVETGTGTGTGTDRKKEQIGGLAAGARARGERLPLDWQPNAALVEYARSYGVNPGLAAEEFRNFWHSAVKNPTKLDWSKTFQNRVLELAEQGKFQLGRKNGADPNADTDHPNWLKF